MYKRALVFLCSSLNLLFGFVSEHRGDVWRRLRTGQKSLCRRCCGEAEACLFTCVASSLSATTIAAVSTWKSGEDGLINGTVEVKFINNKQFWLCATRDFCVCGHEHLWCFDNIQNLLTAAGKCGFCQSALIKPKSTLRSLVSTRWSQCDGETKFS